MRSQKSAMRKKKETGLWQVGWSSRGGEGSISGCVWGRVGSEDFLLDGPVAAAAATAEEETVEEKGKEGGGGLLLSHSVESDKGSSK